jgi:hypothetical protein
MESHQREASSPRTLSNRTGSGKSPVGTFGVRLWATSRPLSNGAQASLGSPVSNSLETPCSAPSEGNMALSPSSLRKGDEGAYEKAESVLDRPLALCGGSGAALVDPAPAKPLTVSTYQPENLEPDYAPGLRPVRMREQPDRPRHHETR